MTSVQPQTNNKDNPLNRQRSMLLLSEAAGAEKIAPIPNAIYEDLSEPEKDRTIITWRNLPGAVRAYLLRCELESALRLLRRESDQFDDNANINQLPNRKFARKLLLTDDYWGWVIVDKEDDTTGMLALDVPHVEGGNQEARVRFNVHQDGYAVALAGLVWDPGRVPRYLAIVFAAAAITISASVAVVAVIINRSHRWIIVGEAIAIDTWKDRVCLMRAQWNDNDRSSSCRRLP